MAPPIKQRIELEGQEEVTRALEAMTDALVKGTEKATQALEGLGEIGRKVFVDLAAEAEKRGGFEFINIDDIKKKLQDMGVFTEETFRKVSKAIEEAVSAERFTKAIDQINKSLGSLGVDAFLELKKKAEEAGTSVQKLPIEDITKKLQEFGFTGPGAVDRVKEALSTLDGSGIKPAKDAVDSLGAGFEKLGSQTKQFVNVIARGLGLDPASAGVVRFTAGLGAAVTALGLLGAAFLKATSDAEQFINRMGNLAAAAGVPIERLDALRRAFEAAGGGTEDFFKAIEALTKRTDEIKVDNVKKLTDEIKKLQAAGGPRDLNVATQLQRLRNVAAGFGPEARAASEALKQFGTTAQSVGGITPRVVQGTQGVEQAFLSLAREVARAESETKKYQIVQTQLGVSSLQLTDALTQLGKQPSLVNLQRARVIYAETAKEARQSAEDTRRFNQAVADLSRELGKLGLGPSDFFRSGAKIIDETAVGLNRFTEGVRKARQNLELPPNLSWIDRVAVTGIARVLQAGNSLKRLFTEGWDTSAAAIAWDFIIKKMQTAIDKLREWLGLQKQATAQPAAPGPISPAQTQSLEEALQEGTRRRGGFGTAAQQAAAFEQLLAIIKQINPALADQVKSLDDALRIGNQLLTTSAQRVTAEEKAATAVAKTAEEQKKASDAAKGALAPASTLEEKTKNIVPPLTEAEKATNVLNEELKKTGTEAENAAKKLQEIKLPPVPKGKFFEILGSAEDAQLAGGTAGDAFVTGFNQAVSGGAAVPAAGAAAPAAGGGSFAWIVDEANKAVEAAVQAFAGLRDKITQALQGGGAVAGGAAFVAPGAAAAAPAAGGGAFQSFIDQARQAVDSIVQEFSTLIQKIAEVARQVGESFIQALNQALQTGMQSVIQGLTTSLGGATEAFRQMVSQSSGELDRLISKMDQAIRKAEELARATRSGGGGLGTSPGGGFFQSGGYTGAGGTTRIAGVVHGGEYVVPARVVRQRGMLGFLEQLRRLGDLDQVLNRFAGFALGGLVPSVNISPRLAVADRQQTRTTTANFYLPSGRKVSLTGSPNAVRELQQYAVVESQLWAGRPPSRYT